MSAQPTYYTLEDVSEMFGLTGTYYLRSNLGSLPHIRIARQVRFTPEHVEEIARIHQQAPTASATTANTFGRRTRGGAA